MQQYDHGSSCQRLTHRHTDRDSDSKQDRNSLPHRDRYRNRDYDGDQDPDSLLNRNGNIQRGDVSYLCAYRFQHEDVRTHADCHDYADFKLDVGVNSDRLLDLYLGRDSYTKLYSYDDTIPGQRPSASVDYAERFAAPAKLGHLDKSCLPAGHAFGAESGR